MIAGNSPRVPHLVKLVGLFLFALWLPATLHCRLEAAGVDFHWLGCHDHESGPCADDPRHALEQQVYKSGSSNEGVGVAPPAGCACALCAPVEPKVVSFFRSSIPPVPPELAAGWRFLARAVAPAQAP